jgi:iduronate 2-sulfatase
MMMKRNLKRSLRWVACTFGLACCAGSAAERGVLSGENRVRPNVLFIAADDLRNDIGCYGNPIAKTPNLDRLAARGVRFDRAYCQQALCNPSRASLMTGRRPDRIRVWDLGTHFRDHVSDVITLPQWFRRNGYHAENIGKIYHNSGRSAEDKPSWSVPAIMHSASHYMDKALAPGEKPPVKPRRDVKYESLDVPDDAYFDGRIAGLAVEALQRLKKSGEPFFLAVGFWKPHLPFNAPKKYWDLYSPDDILPPDPAGWPKNAPRIAWHNGWELLGNNGTPPSAEEALRLRHGYYAAISYLDAQAGKVLDALKSLGLAENTVVVFWSDNGFHLGEQTLWCKTSNFELDTRVPLIISAPGQKCVTGVSTKALVELLDLYPTLVNLCGLPAPEKLDGKDLTPILQGSSERVRQAALSQHPRPAYPQKGSLFEAMGYSVRLPDCRYTEWRDWKSGKAVASEFYDYSGGLCETANRIDDPAQSARIKAAKSELDLLIREGKEHE